MLIFNVMNTKPVIDSKNSQKCNFVMFNGTQLFEEGYWKRENRQGNIGIIFSCISAQFNQMKAKLFNLVESSMTDEKQREAMKGLIKGFANDAFNNTMEDLDEEFKVMGFKIDENPGSTNSLDLYS